MKKLVPKALIFISFFLFFSCNDVDYPANESYFQISVNGKQYDGNIGEINLLEQKTCDDKSSFILDVGEVENSDVFLRMRLMHYSVLNDFISKGEGSYEIKRNPLEDLCHFDGLVYYEDKTQDDYTTSVKSGGVNTITDIQKLEETDYMVSYSIQGNFNVTIVNSIDEELTVTGEYNVQTIVYK